MQRKEIKDIKKNNDAFWKKYRNLKRKRFKFIIDINHPLYKFIMFVCVYHKHFKCNEDALKYFIPKIKTLISRYTLLSHIYFWKSWQVLEVRKVLSYQLSQIQM